MTQSPDVCILKENFHCPALKGDLRDSRIIQLIIDCNTRGCNLAKNILNNPRDVFGGRFVGNVDHFGDKQDAPLILVHERRMAKA